MNLAKVLLRSGALSSKSNVVLRSSLVAKQASKNSSIISRRMLMSSRDTGGIKAYQSPRRVKPVVKIWSALFLIPCCGELYFFFSKEDEINKFLGTDWNTGLVGLVAALPFMTVLGCLIMMPTIPL